MGQVRILTFEADGPQLRIHEARPSFRDKAHAGLAAYPGVVFAVLALSTLADAKAPPATTARIVATVALALGFVVIGAVPALIVFTRPKRRDTWTIDDAGAAFEREGRPRRILTWKEVIRVRWRETSIILVGETGRIGLERDDLDAEAWGRIRSRVRMMLADRFDLADAPPQDDIPSIRRIFAAMLPIGTAFLLVVLALPSLETRPKLMAWVILAFLVFAATTVFGMGIRAHRAEMIRKHVWRDAQGKAIDPWDV